MSMFRRLWKDDAGFVVSAELVLVATIVVIGMIVGLTSVRDGVTSELSDVAGAIQNLNQGYAIYGVVGHASATNGSDFADNFDFCDDDNDPVNAADNCITFNGLPQAENGSVPIPGQIVVGP